MARRGVLVLFGAATLVAPLIGSMPMSAGATLATSASAGAAASCFSTDNGDPVLETFAIEPRTVDARNGAKVVTFTATVEDAGGPGAPAGVSDATAYVGYDQRGHWNREIELTLDRTGALVGTLTVLPQAPDGPSFVSLVVRDKAKNSTYYSTDDLEALGLPATFTTETEPDAAKPTVKSLRLSTGVVDTRRRSRSVTVTVRATDDKAVAAVGVWLTGLRGGVRRADLELVSGTPRDGRWTGRLLIPRWAGSTTGQLGVGVTDAVGRMDSLPSRRLAKAGQPSLLRVVSRTDRSRPSVSIVAVTPTSVDVTAATQTVRVVARARDLRSGVRRVVARLFGPDGPEGYGSVTARLSRVSGTSRNGIWKGTLALAPCEVPAGKWAVVVTAKDASRSGGGRFESVTVVNADVRPPTAWLAGDYWRVRPVGPLSVAFHEDVRGVGAANMLVHVGDSRRGRAGDGPAAIPGSWSCADAAGAVVDCATGPVRTAAFTPAAPLIPSTNHTLVLNPEGHLGLTDLAGNPYSPYAPQAFRTD